MGEAKAIVEYRKSKKGKEWVKKEKDGGKNRLTERKRREKISRVGSSQNENQKGPFLFWNKDHRTYSLRNKRKIGKIRE